MGEFWYWLTEVVPEPLFLVLVCPGTLFLVAWLVSIVQHAAGAY